MSENLSHDLSVAFHTLGCKVNHHDSDVMKGLFKAAGYRIVDFSEVADIYVINTCTVTHLSDRKSRQMIRRAASQNNLAIIAVCGCYVQASPEEVRAIEDVDLLLGTNERHKIVEAIEQFMLDGKKKTYLPSKDAFNTFEPIEETRVSEMTRAYLKIQEGCEQFCTYCIIPYARGPLRSRKSIDVIEAVRKLENQGYREVILTGIHLGAYGHGENDEPQVLSELCRMILNQTGIERIRLSSIEPTEISDELIDLIKNHERMAKHLHIPLQCGSDKILQDMNRPYTKQDYRYIVNKIREKIPTIAITTDLMVGFPGETETYYQESYDFVDEMQFSGMHIFKYSPRKGTPAATYQGSISPELKDSYSKKMHVLAKVHEYAYMDKFIGEILEVLIEEKTDFGYTGHTSNYLRIYTNDEVAIGHFTRILIEKRENERLIGRQI